MRRLLFIDDRESSRRQFQELLTAKGREVATVANGMEALAEARARPPALAILGRHKSVTDDPAWLAQWAADPQLNAIPMAVCPGNTERPEDWLLAAGVRPEDPSAEEPAATPDYSLEETNRRLREEIAACHRAEEALRGLGERYYLVATAAGDGLWDWDIAAGSVYYSTRFCELLGEEALPPGEQDILARVHEDDRERARAALSAHLERREPFSLHCRFGLKSGDSRWFAARGQAVWDGRGRPRRMAGSICDITEQKRAEDTVRKSEASLALAQRIAHLGGWELELATGKLEWSDESYRIFGVARGTFIPSSEAFHQLVHPEDRERVRAAVDASRRTGQPYMIDHRVIRPDGIERSVREHADVILDQSGKPVRVAGTVQDITELKRIEKSLQNSERHFRSLIEHAQDMITIVEGDGRITYQSQSSLPVGGYQAEALLGRNVFEFVHPDDHAAVREALRRAIAEPERPAAAEFRFHHADGSWRVLESIGKSLGSGETPTLVVNSRDITDRRRLEEQLRQSQKMEAIGQLAGGVAHDFNNLLTIIQGSASLLTLPGLKPGEPEEALQQIRVAAERAAGLTRQLLLFSRRQVMQPVTLNLNDVVANITRMLQRLLGEDIALRSEYAPGVPPARADAGMIEQILLNLAVNSRDAMPHGGRLTITTSATTIGPDETRDNPDARPGRFATLTVSDTGGGIPADVLPHIFEPFFTTKEIGKGTGLGLATVYGIVQQHHGWIKVNSVAGTGTSFAIHLPATAEEVAPAPPPPTRPQFPRGHETVLVVEDENSLRQLVGHLLKRAGYTVLLAASGPSALELWREQKEGIQLLLTDVIMPDGMTGRQLAEQLQGERPALKVIYTSGYSADILKQGPQMVEGVNFLQKPFEGHKLIQAVRDSLDRA